METIKDNPLDRIRAAKESALESRDNCYAIVAIDRDKTSAVLPYSHLSGAIAEAEKFVLMHSLAIVTVVGPADVLGEACRLLAQQRLATIRHGVGNLSVEIQPIKEDVS